MMDDEGFKLPDETRKRLHPDVAGWIEGYAEMAPDVRAAGRNRSGIVIAEHLIQTGWGSAEKVIATIQTARHKALTNDAFVAWLMRPR